MNNTALTRPVTGNIPAAGGPGDAQVQEVALDANDGEVPGELGGEMPLEHDGLGGVQAQEIGLEEGAVVEDDGYAFDAAG